MSGTPDLRPDYAAEGLNPKSAHDPVDDVSSLAGGPMPRDVKKPVYQLDARKLDSADVESIYKELTTFTDVEVVKEFLKYRQSPGLLDAIQVKIRREANDNVEIRREANVKMLNVLNLYTQYSSFNVQDIGDAIRIMFSFNDQELDKIKEISNYLATVELDKDDKSYNDFIRKAYELFTEYKSLRELVIASESQPDTFVKKVETIKGKEMVNDMIKISKTAMNRGGKKDEYINMYLTKKESSKQGGLKKSKNYKKSRKSRKSRKYPKSRKSRKSRKYYH